MAKYPINVWLLKLYGNGLRPALDSGKFIEERVKTEDGFILTNYFIFKKEKKGGKPLKIPAMDLKNYQNIELDNGKSERWLYLLQIERDMFLPLTLERGKIFVNMPVPVYEYDVQVDEKGEPIKVDGKFQIKIGEDGQPLFRKDENGNLIQARDDKGKPLRTFVKKLIMDSAIAMDNGKVIDVQSLIPQRLYDKEHFISDVIETAERTYRSKSFWDRYGNVIIMCVAIFGIIATLAITLNGFAQTADKFVEGSKIMAEGFNNAVALCKPAVTTTPPITGQPPF